MRVLQVHNVQSTYGGVDEVIRLEAAGLQRRGHQTDLFEVITSEVVGRGKARAALLSAWNQPAVRELQKRIADFEPDVVHYHTPFPVASLALIKVASSTKRPSIATSHSFRYSCLSGTLLRDGQVCEDCIGKSVKLAGVRHRCYHSSLPGSMSLAIGHALHRTVDDYRRAIGRFLVMTEFGRSILIREGIEPQRIVVKPNFSQDFAGTDKAGTDARPRPKRFAYVGRLEPEKGVRTMIEAWTEHSNGRAVLQVAGTGSLEKWIRARLKAHGDGTASMLGFQSRRQLIELYRSVDYLIFPSEWYEAGPTLSMMEAFSAGCPIIASDVGNFSDAIQHRKNGWLFTSGSPAALGISIEDAITASNKEYRDMSFAARRSYEEHYSEDVVMSDLISVYSDVIAEHQAGT